MLRQRSSTGAVRLAAVPLPSARAWCSSTAPVPAPSSRTWCRCSGSAVAGLSEWDAWRHGATRGPGAGPGAPLRQCAGPDGGGPAIEDAAMPARPPLRHRCSWRRSGSRPGGPGAPGPCVAPRHGTTQPRRRSVRAWILSTRCRATAKASKLLGYRVGFWVAGQHSLFNLWWRPSHPLASETRCSTPRLVSPRKTPTSTRNR